MQALQHRTARETLISKREGKPWRMNLFSRLLMIKRGGIKDGTIVTSGKAGMFLSEGLKAPNPWAGGKQMRETGR
jgi:hypothetical protein